MSCERYIVKCITCGEVWLFRELRAGRALSNEEATAEVLRGTTVMNWYCSSCTWDKKAYQAMEKLRAGQPYERAGRGPV
jgi:hypothetical protein